MIEAIVVQYLSEKLDPVPVCAERPERPDPSYVLIERTGSEIREHIHYATIAVQSYAPTMLSAAVLNDQVVCAMRDIDTLPDISHVGVNSAGYNFSDPEAREYRYQSVFDLVYYE